MRIRMVEHPVRYPVLLANVQALMARHEWDQSELAHRTGVSQGTVSRWGAISAPRGPALAKLAELAGVSPTEFLEQPIPATPRRARSSLPSGRKLVAAMRALLESVDLGHLADEHAERLARRLPSLLEEMQSPEAPDERGEGPPLGGPSPSPSRPRPDTQQ